MSITAHSTALALMGLTALAAASGCSLAPASEAQEAGAETVQTADSLFDAYLEEDRGLIARFEARSDTGVVDELAHRTARDQAIRQLMLELLQTPGAGPDEAAFTWIRLVRRMQQLDRDNASWLQDELTERTWFTISEYGAEADNNAFLIVQHATHDPDFMRDIHTRFTRLLPLNEIAPDNYALLTDRLAVMDGAPQPYGSQFECHEGEQRLQTELADSEAVTDERRAEAGLPTLAEYRALLPDCGSLPGGG